MPAGMVRPVFSTPASAPTRGVWASNGDTEFVVPLFFSQQQAIEISDWLPLVQALISGPVKESVRAARNEISLVQIAFAKAAAAAKGCD